MKIAFRVLFLIGLLWLIAVAVSTQAFMKITYFSYVLDYADVPTFSQSEFSAITKEVYLRIARAVPNPLFPGTVMFIGWLGEVFLQRKKAEAEQGAAPNPCPVGRSDEV